MELLYLQPKSLLLTVIGLRREREWVIVDFDDPESDQPIIFHLPIRSEETPKLGDKFDIFITPISK